MNSNNQFDVIIIGAGPGGIFSAYELMQKKPDLKVAVFESGYSLEKRRCPIDGVKVKSCIKCPTCAIMNGFGGAGAFSDGKYNITNDFGGTLYEYIGKKEAIDLMKYAEAASVDKNRPLNSRFRDTYAVWTEITAPGNKTIESTRTIASSSAIP